MRYAELAFLAFMIAYHMVLLVPRHRRAFPANYLVFLAGMALAWNLGMEGLRWQTLPPTILLLIDLFILFPTFATLRGTPPSPGFLPALGGVFRTFVASVGFLLTVGCTLLAVAFPLPQVALTGGLSPADRVVRFPATSERPAMELRVWYPASGDMRTKARPQAEPEAWKKIAQNGGLPVFWQSYLEHLPSSLIRGGKMAAPNTRYPVVYVALPARQSAEDFGYLFEDLASRGMLVVAGRPLPAPLGPQPVFTWTSALNELWRPFEHTELWFEPESSLAADAGVTDYSWLPHTKEALRQLDSEPGDLLFSTIDWAHQALWVWGSGESLSNTDQKALALRGVIHVGGQPAVGHRPNALELWISAEKAPKGQKGQWFLNLPRMTRADVADVAYLKPYLAFTGLKSQADAGMHGALRQYQAAFLQFALWGSGSDMTFGQTVPEVPGFVLTGQ